MFDPHSRQNHYPHFADGDTEAQGGQVTSSGWSLAYNLSVRNHSNSPSELLGGQAAAEANLDIFGGMDIRGTWAT